MDKTAIKNYAIWARTKLIEDIKYKASLLGITEKVVADALPQSTTQEQYFDIGTREPYAIRGVQIAQRRSLAEAIKKKAQESDYLTAYNSIIEEVAYTWFNRFIAVRFMEVNDYLPCKIRVLSAVDGRQEPDIVQNPFDAKLDYTSAEEELISQHQMNNEGDKLFNMLFVKVCNDLSKVLPQLFEAEQDYTELLLNISYTDQDGLIYKLVHDIPEDNFDVNAVDEEGKPIGQVEIIGWLYQYYNTEPKNETFALLKKNVKITKERIPSATQLFTPDWIVRYMVENSLGRLVISGQGLVDSEEERIAKEKELAERFGWKYYLPEAKQDADVRKQLNQLTTNNYSPETIKVIDPCMGSGHILVYAFDVLMQIYTQMGYTDKDAVLSILENNLYGLDIDKRAFQLAYFAVLMKARQYHKFILKKQPQCHIYAIAESNGINMKHLAYFGAQLDELAKPVALNQMQELIATLHDAKEYGSIISVADYDWDLLHQFDAEFDINGEMNLFDSFGIEATQQRLQELVAVGEVLAQKYEVVVTNPPYMGASNMNPKLNEFIKQKYTDYKSDFFSAFIIRASEMTKQEGYCGFFTPYVWMFIQSYEKLRKYLYSKATIETLIQFEYSAFEEATVPVCTFAFKNSCINKKGCYLRLVDFRGGMEIQRQKTLEAISNHNCGFYYEQCSDNFAKIPGAPVAYWLSNRIYDIFNNKDSDMKKYCLGEGKNVTTNNAKYILNIWEVAEYKVGAFNLKWLPCAMGGEYRKWYGNIVNVIDWSIEAQSFYRKNKAGRIIRKEFWNMFGVTWGKISSGRSSFRFLNFNQMYQETAILQKSKRDTLCALAILNSKISSFFLDFLSPTINFQLQDICNIPVLKNAEIDDDIVDLSKKNISLSKSDWDAFENSWDFTKHPLIVTSDQCIVNRDSSANTQLSTNHSSLSTISQAYQRWEEETNARFTQLKANEEELNRIFIDIYGLQDELTPEVEDKDVTVRKADLQRDIKSLLSYAVGCMFGRYSLDVEGLAYAGGEFSDQWVVISDQCYRREVVEKYVAQELQRAYGMAEVNVADGRDLSSSEVIAERGVIFTFGSDEKSSSFDSIKYRRGTSKKLYEDICELSFNSERIKCGIGNATYDLCSPEILNAITSGSGVELVQRGWQDADSIDWQTIHHTLKTNHYGADEDNVIPITDEDYFEDDIIGRLIAWLKVVYGAETLEENLRFIADALGTSGDTARKKIRNYFLKDFFKDHCKIYQKRPIYWLYDSGKQNGFKALIYMHRYNADTSGQVRAEYLGKMEETYESEINRMQDIMDNGAGREVALAGKRKEKLQKQLHECRDYDAVLGHIALASIAIDLDDGVKVNYVKVQTAKDGKVLPILAKI